MGMSQQGQFGGGKGSQAQLGGQMGQPGMMYPGGSPGGGLAGLGGARGNWGGGTTGPMQQKLQSLLGQQRQLGGGFMSGPSAPNAWGGGSQAQLGGQMGQVGSGHMGNFPIQNMRGNTEGFGMGLPESGGGMVRTMDFRDNGFGVDIRDTPGYGRPGGVPGTIGGFGGYQGPGAWGGGGGLRGLRPPPQFGGPFQPRMPGGPFGGYNPSQQWASQFSPFGGYGGGGKGMGRIQPFNPMMQRLF